MREDRDLNTAWFKIVTFIKPKLSSSLHEKVKVKLSLYLTKAQGHEGV
jgi:hypothetical protein